MKNKKLKASILVEIMLVVAMLIVPNFVKAQEKDISIYLSRRELRQNSQLVSKIGFSIGDPDYPNHANIWKFVKHDSSSRDSDFDDTINFYCVKDGIGFSTENEPNLYNKSFDFVEDRTAMQAKSEDEHLKSLVDDDDTYYQIMALADLIYVKGAITPEGMKTTNKSAETDKQKLLQAAGIDPQENYLSDDMIDAIQQAAFWYFSNRDDGSYEDKYNKYGKYSGNWFYYTLDGQTWKALTDGDLCSQLGGDTTDVPEQVDSLYEYLIDTAKTNAQSYKNDGRKAKNKITLFTNLDIGRGAGSTQPLIVVEKVREFDLALRKYITKVDNVDVSQMTGTRAPSITATEINNSGTAKYAHRKDPVTVKQGSKVTYNITIYNEGEAAGIAKEIIDQLPTGLKYSSIDSNSKYTASYEPDSNKITFTRKDEENPLEPYAGGSDLDSETITFVCEVEEKSTSGKDKSVLTNIAWISQEKNTETELNINQEGDERDSLPTAGRSPNKGQEDLPTYHGNDRNKGANNNEKELGDSSYFFKGQEDDDDFEKLQLLPNDFDLALTKAICEVNGKSVDERITNENVDKLKAGTLTDTDMEYDKNATPVKVKKGDIVKYRIRVYNEGDTAGYASEVTDDIPDGLEFIYSLQSDDEIDQDTTLSDLEKEALKYNQLVWEKSEWPKEGSSTKIPVAVSDYLAKGKGADLVQDKSNLLKPFDKNKDFIDTETDKNPDYRDLFIYMRVISENKRGTKIRNEAAITGDTDENGDEIDDRDSQPDSWPGREPSHNYQDEEDYDILELQEFDLALRKFITAVSPDETIEENEKLMDKEDSSKYAREPKVDASLLNTEGDDGETITTATYEHSKEPLVVNKNAYIVYMLRAYNEGDFAGYATKITDYLPEGLDYIDGEFNKQYGWSYDAETRTVSTEYLKNELINAPAEVRGKLELDYAEVPIMCRLNNTVRNNVNQTNIAEIAEDKDYDGNDVDDRDSTPDNLVEPEDKPGYKDEESDEPYVPGQQDDDDFEKVLVKPFDLALRKFITKVEDKTVDSRIPQLSWNEEENRIQYKHPKEEAPVEVVTGNIVEYTIRVFNEGVRDGYASQILDDIPEGLEFLPENETNIESRWVMYRKLRDGETATEDAITQDNETYVKTENVSEAEVIVTDYLSMEQGKARMGEDDTENPALLTAYDEEKGITDTNPDYADVKVAFKVIEPGTSNRIVVNSAQISKDTDENGKEIDDDDSETGIWNEGEDDQDKEYVKVNYFDLALRKWVTQAIVIENGKQTVTQTGHYAEQDPEPIVKVDLNRKKLNQVTVKFRYSIRITNQGNIAGYAKEITDYVPEGLKFVAQDNPGWTDEGNNVISTKLLADKLLQPGESADIEVLLTWINKEDNMGLKTNTAEISEDYNDQGVPDIDSTPDNKKPKEDDIDDAPVMLSIKTGKVQVYIVLSLSILITIAGGVALIKKYVI